jgi:hypothetical protein
MFGKKQNFIVTVRCDGRSPWLGAKDFFDGYRDVDVQVNATSWENAEKEAYKLCLNTQTRPSIECWSQQVIGIRRVFNTPAP